MSVAHNNTFERIRIEHEEVVRLLREQARSGGARPARRKDPSTGLPTPRNIVLEGAVASANDAYALLLIATAEGFMRAYLAALGVPLGREPKLNTLIDKCRKECNARSGGTSIHQSTAAEVHSLRDQRNNYAHGVASAVFPTVPRVAMVLARFFDRIP
jgi:hypothetical protein